MQKVLPEIHHAIQLKAEIKRTMEMAGFQTPTRDSGIMVEEKVNLQKVKYAQYFFFFKWVTETVQT